jgi:hypothetical protein
MIDFFIFVPPRLLTDIKPSSVRIFQSAASQHRVLWLNIRFAPQRTGRRTACDVRFGSQADICAAIGNVRFTPDFDRA